MKFFNRFKSKKVKIKKVSTHRKAKPSIAVKRAIKHKVIKSRAAKKTVKKAVKKTIRKSIKKSIRKSAKKSTRKTVRKSIRKAIKKSAKKKAHIKRPAKRRILKAKARKAPAPKPVKKVKVMEFKNPETVRACPECGSRRVRYSEFNKALICKECGVMYPALAPELEQTYVDLQK